MGSDRFSAEPVLARLKDFQRRTVDYVFNRFYGRDPTTRFLVADEVGLGKTLVAKGIIARAYEHMQDKVDRFDVIYVCSNAAIASQNVNRLNLFSQEKLEFATRMTFLPMQIKQISGNKINFISFTPGTAFKLKHRGGTMPERAIIYQMLRGSRWDRGHGLLNLLQGDVRDVDNWRWHARKRKVDLDPNLSQAFVEALQNDRELSRRIDECCELYKRYRRKRRPWAERNQAYAVIGALRQLLAQICVNALEPDLVILDEFQCFKDLLDGDDQTAQLARSLFEYPGARTLLLSATPYRMLTLDVETEGDHYQDLLRTVAFLMKDGSVNELRQLIRDYRAELFGLDSDPASNGPSGSREKLQELLLRVMCRTERVRITSRMDAMLAHLETRCVVDQADLRQAAQLDSVARALGSPDVIEYWKSSPYLLSFLREYQLGRMIEDESPEPRASVIEAISNARDSMLSEETIDNYRALDTASGRMRALISQTIDAGMWRLLWIPPSLPYSTPAGSYAGLDRLTKTLVFSSWAMVPEAIASICSYEAERLMLAGLGRDIRYGELHARLRPLLRFAVDTADNRLTGMPTLIWMMPSPTLAALVDPLEIAIRLGRGHTVSPEAILDDAERTIGRYLPTMAQPAVGGRGDERWYWAVPAILERNSRFLRWCDSPQGWVSAVQEGDQGSRFNDHLTLLVSVATKGLERPGAQPDDLVRVIALLALAGPGTCALRSLHRIAPQLSADDPTLLSAAARIAEGFRTLFNLPESIGVLRAATSDQDYWQLTLRYCLEGNLQALLDEQCHVLVDSLGVTGHSPEARVREVAEHIASSLSIRSARVQAREYFINTDQILKNDFNMRSRFALRLAEIKDDRGSTIARASLVRDAFNSPFRPFILATTSIGQEGLDFHTWCHAVMHWNLPSNPVDLEQREGRVHRYKGHAIRKNIAEKYGLHGLIGWGGMGDPWQHLFDRAKSDRPAGSSDLIPYWVFEEGSARIERRIPILPLSREERRLEDLLRGLALYRLVFGQPRQEDLLAHLIDRGVDPKRALDQQVSLAPPVDEETGPQ